MLERAITSACRRVADDNTRTQIGRNDLKKEETWLVN